MSHKKYRAETNCLNCGAEVQGKFCSNCGQENIETRENFFHMAFEFVSDYFHFDSKFFRSLIPLFIKPGFLTKEYWEGRRVKYIHPLRIFFFVTIVFVISTSFFYKKFGDQFKSKLIQPDTSLIKLDDAYLNSLPDSAKLYVPSHRDSVTVKAIKEEKVKDARQLAKLNRGMDNVFVNLKYVTFFLLPVYALFFKILYRRRRPYYVDHLIYAMHLLTFAYCLFSITLLLPWLFPIGLEAMRQISVWIIMLYIGFSVHYLYRQVWWKLILKTIIASFLVVFTTILVVIGTALIDAMLIQ
jgi:hypothetical protein